MFENELKLNVNRIENVFGGNGSQRTFLNFGGKRIGTATGYTRSNKVGDWWVARGALSWTKRLRPVGDSSPDRATRV